MTRHVNLGLIKDKKLERKTLSVDVCKKESIYKKIYCRIKMQWLSANKSTDEWRNSLCISMKDEGL